VTLRSEPVIFRVDASSRIGTGHVTRCLTLANGLARQADPVRKVLFVCRTDEGNLIDRIEANGFNVIRIPPCETATSKGASIQPDHPDYDWQSDAQQCLKLLSAFSQVDWLIVDHYILDACWERMVRPVAKRIMVIDDLANRPHDCDWLVDQTYGEDGTRYRGLLPADCHTMFGATYAMLKPQFATVRAQLAPHIRPTGPRTIHVFFGGTDIRENTIRFVTLLLERFPGILLKVAVGPGSAFESKLKKLASHYERRLFWEKDIANMAEHMSACDIAIGAPGMATWERACLGLPAAYVATLQNQVPILDRLKAAGFCEFVGLDSEVTDEYFIDTMRMFLGDPERLSAMRQRGMQAIDGKGARRVISAMLGTEYDG
jgi:UDP-2,4-diacetamido-2,4,6-trideoxy-beta-L-altropyranose hydrolase